jgi:hypothetical protein
MDRAMREELRVEATSFTSFEDAIEQAFAKIPGDPEREGLASAEVVRWSLSKGGFVGRTQYHVELVAVEVSDPDSQA